jgi:23S rRNA (uracil1939-C5)-methyltransferase
MFQQGQIVEVEITDLTDKGEGVGRSPDRVIDRAENLVIFVPDTVPGDRVSVRLVHVKRQYAHGKLDRILEPSPHRQRPNCIVADKCGGCQWQHITYPYQRAAKQNQVIQALERIGGFSQPPVDPVLAGHSELGYRNKATYPLRLSATGQVQAGYYQKGSHKLVNLNRCPVQDSRLDPLLAQVKQDIQQRGWSIYDEKLHQGEMRHLGLQIGRRTGEMLLTLVANHGTLPGLEEQAQQWLQHYPQLVGVCININGDRTNRILGDQTRCLAGQPFLREEFAGCKFHLRSETFFQVNTEAAEALLAEIVAALKLSGDEVLLDAYCGVGTFTLPLAKQVKQAIGWEVQASAVEQAQKNAKLNGLTNVTFYAAKVEASLSQLLETDESKITQHPSVSGQIDIVLLDPPRSGCDRSVIESLLQLKPQRIVYISCKPATLARDLKLLCQDGGYHLTRVQPADFFPQTAHVECAAFLSLE